MLVELFKIQVLRVGKNYPLTCGELLYLIQKRRKLGRIELCCAYTNIALVSKNFNFSGKKTAFKIVVQIRYLVSRF